MRKMLSRLRSRAGESFAEILVAIMVVGLAALLMASMVTASQGLDTNAKMQDKEFYAAIQKVEEGGTTVTSLTDPKMKITTDTSPVTVEVPVKVYSDKETDGTLFAYEVK